MTYPRATRIRAHKDSLRLFLFRAAHLSNQKRILLSGDELGTSTSSIPPSPIKHRDELSTPVIFLPLPSKLNKARFLFSRRFKNTNERRTVIVHFFPSSSFLRRLLISFSHNGRKALCNIRPVSFSNGLLHLSGVESFAKLAKFLFSNLRKYCRDIRHASPEIRCIKICTDMQEKMWARLRDSRPGACLIHATYFPAFLYIKQNSRWPNRLR